MDSSNYIINIQFMKYISVCFDFRNQLLTKKLDHPVMKFQFLFLKQLLQYSPVCTSTRHANKCITHSAKRNVEAMTKNVNNFLLAWYERTRAVMQLLCCLQVLKVDLSQLPNFQLFIITIFFTFSSKRGLCTTALVGGNVPNFFPFGVFLVLDGARD